MCRWPVALSVEFGVVRLVLLEHIVDNRKEHSGNGNNGFLVSSALFESHIAITDFRELLGTDSTKSTLNKQRFDVSSGPADSGGFLFPCTLVVLWRKTSPGAEMLRGGKHGHIRSNFRNDADCGKGLDTQHRHNKVKLRKVFLSSSQNQRFQIILTKPFLLSVGMEGVVIAAATITAFYLGLSYGGAAAGQTMAFSTLCLSRLFHSFSCKSQHPVLLTRKFWNNRALLGAFAAGSLLLGLVLFVPALESLFSVVPLSIGMLGAVVGLAFCSMLMIQMLKRFRRGG